MKLKYIVPALVAVAAVPAFADGGTGVDTSSIVTLIGTGVAAVAAIGAAKLGVQGVVVLWNKVSSALGQR
ncbi:hypothetical protein BUE93_08855 [Chromobacterium amazonense]|uniref:Uncharacterized protein n=1 Tax=Chromobacterium amazonense TaxID=1382803 RepID=A0A2S9X5T9_9NEIS|nr:major capsid protein [Chromobacterium amazonense]PRP71053.1 hypothetical protein BUE93_08855 [Chromobacterium amazonense]